MSENEHVLDLIPAYALNCLDEADFQEVSSHLAECKQCQAETQSYMAVVDKLALASPDATPSTAVKQALMDRVKSDLTQEGIEKKGSFWDRLGKSVRKAPAWGLVSAALVVLLLVTNLALLRQVNQPQITQHPAQLRTVNLTGTDAAPEAKGMIVISSGDEYGTLVVDHLPVLDSNLQYQLWLIRDGVRTSGAVFSVAQDGYGSVVISSPRHLTDYTSFGITIEPTGGSPGPTGEKVLGGNL